MTPINSTHRISCDGNFFADEAEEVGNKGMGQSLASQRAASDGEHLIPMRHWHPNGYKISVYSSLIVAVAIGLFFIVWAGWSPPDSWQGQVDNFVTWILLTYIWVQMGSLVLVGVGNKNQMWIDALTSIVPLFISVYVIIQHYAGYVILSPFQIKTAWVTAYTMLLDVVIDLGVTVLLSRQVIDFGHTGMR